MIDSSFSVKPGQKFDLVVHPAARPLSGEITAQPSKNYTTRYLLAAALGDGNSTVRNCATSADSLALQRCVQQMGASVSVKENESFLDIEVSGFSGRPKLLSNDPINPGNAGAVLRFLLAIGALLPEVTFVTDHPESLGKRPNLDLLVALKDMGCQFEPESGLLPITLRGGNLHGGRVTIDGSRSSQFLSGLLFLAPLIGEEVCISVTGNLVSKAPIRQTVEVLRRASIAVDHTADLASFTVKPGIYRAGEYKVNGDWPGSAAILAAVAVTGGSATLLDLLNDEQGEKASAQVLTDMGAETIIKQWGGGVTIRGGNSLQGVNFDGDLATDAVLALMGAACFADGKTRFYNVSNLRIKECDRISEPIAELRKLGVKCWEGNEIGDPDPDAIIIEGNPEGYEGGVTVDGRDDHRVIMLLSIVALRCRKPVTILRAHQVAKSYPDYFGHLATLGAKMELVEENA